MLQLLHPVLGDRALRPVLQALQEVKVPRAVLYEFPAHSGQLFPETYFPASQYVVELPPPPPPPPPPELKKRRLMGMAPFGMLPRL